MSVVLAKSPRIAIDEGKHDQSNLEDGDELVDFRRHVAQRQ